MLAHGEAANATTTCSYLFHQVGNVEKLAFWNFVNHFRIQNKYTYIYLISLLRL